eukprot:m.15620 g.15620  ORF g.15620 m.15620 type:complete len:450 (+) comp5061_c1_seq1:658-2007(+)
MSVLTLKRRQSSFFVTERAVYLGFVHCDTDDTSRPNATVLPGVHEQFKRGNVKKTQALHPLFARGFPKPLQLTVDGSGLHMEHTGETSTGEVVRAPMRKMVFAGAMKRHLYVFVTRGVGRQGKFNCHALKLASPKKSYYLASLIVDAVAELDVEDEGLDPRGAGSDRKQRHSLPDTTSLLAGHDAVAAGDGRSATLVAPSNAKDRLPSGRSKAATLSVDPSSGGSGRSFAEQIRAAGKTSSSISSNGPKSPASDCEEVFGFNMGEEFGFDGDFVDGGDDEDDPFRRINSLRGKDDPADEYFECTDEIEDGFDDSGVDAVSQASATSADRASAATTTAASAADASAAVPLDQQPWFHGSLDRKTAVRRLTGLAPGTFLVRNGSSRSGFSLSLVLQTGVIQHFRIEKEGSSRFYVAGNEFATFQSLAELVFAYNTKRLTDEGDRLLTPCQK